MSLRVCNEPGCPELVERGKCLQHRRERWRKQNATRPSARAQGYDDRWERTRKSFLAIHPLCERCGNEATDAHHRDDLGAKGPRGHDHANLEALCRSCHTRESAITHGLGGAA